MVVKLIRSAPKEHIYGCKRYSGAAAGDLAKVDAKVAAVTDRPLGFIIDEIRTDNPPAMVDLHGTGAIIDGLISAGTVGAPVYSDGDGTISTTQPAGSCYIVGHIYPDEDGSTSTIVEINIQRVEAEV